MAEEASEKISRGDFLKRSAAAAAGVTLAATQRGDRALPPAEIAKRREAKEILDIGPHILMIDTYSDEPELFQNIPPDYQTFAQTCRRLLKKDYISPLALKAALLLNGVADGDHKALFRLCHQKPRLAPTIIAHGILASKKGHGIEMAKAMKKTLLHHPRLDISPRLEPVQNMIDSFQHSLDPNGESLSFSLEISPTKLVDGLKKHPKQKVVNFPFQLGPVGMEIRLKNDELSYEARGAYCDEETEGNLRQLFSVCRQFPDKLFCAGLGNEGEDITTARENMRNAWPPNLLFVGALEEQVTTAIGGKIISKQMVPANQVRGADVYVYTQDFNIPSSSSAATSIISAMAAVGQAALTQANPEETIGYISQFCKPAGFSKEVLVLDAQKFKDSFQVSP